MRTTQHGTRSDHDIIQAHIFPTAADVLPRTHIRTQPDAAGACVVVGKNIYLLDRHHRIGMRRYASAGHDLPRRTQLRRTGICPCCDRARHYMLAARCCTKPLCGDGKPIHGAVIEWWQLGRARQRLRKYTALGIGAVHPLAG